MLTEITEEGLVPLDAVLAMNVTSPEGHHDALGLLCLTLLLDPPFKATDPSLWLLLGARLWLLSIASCSGWV